MIAKRRPRPSAGVAPALSAVALVAAVTASFLEAHHAVLRFNLEEMEAASDRIFIGRCVGVEEAGEIIAGGMLPITRYTFEVEEVLKGNLPARFTFTQLGHPPDRMPKAGAITSHGAGVKPGFSLHGAGEFGVGDRLLLFLIPDYQGGRLTYPVGLDQGAFFISHADGDEERARNNLNNLGLFTAPYNGVGLSRAGARVVHPEEADPLARAGDVSASVRALSEKRGALPLAPLVELIRKIGAAHRGPDPLANNVNDPTKSGGGVPK